MRERDAYLLKSMDEQARVIVDAALERWRLWVVGATMIIALLITLGGCALFTLGERSLATLAWAAAGMTVGVPKLLGVFKGLSG